MNYETSAGKGKLVQHKNEQHDRLHFNFVMCGAPSCILDSVTTDWATL